MPISIDSHFKRRQTEPKKPNRCIEPRTMCHTNFPFNPQSVDVIWPVDVLLIPERSIAMLRYHNSFRVVHIPMLSQKSDPTPKLSFSASRLDRIQRPLRMGMQSTSPLTLINTKALHTSRKTTTTKQKIPIKRLQAPGARARILIQHEAAAMSQVLPIRTLRPYARHYVLSHGDRRQLIIA